MIDKIAVIGLGYVGLPLARLFATKYPVVGFDINAQRISELNNGIDVTLEVEEGLLKSVLVGSTAALKTSGLGLYCSNTLEDIAVLTILLPFQRL